MDNPKQPLVFTLLVYQNTDIKLVEGENNPTAAPADDMSSTTTPTSNDKTSQEGQSAYAINKRDKKYMAKIILN